MCPVMPVATLVFFGALALAGAECFEHVPDDLVAALQVAQTQKPGNESVNPGPQSLTPDGHFDRPGDSFDGICGDFLLEDARKTQIALRPRRSSAKVIDTFAFGNAYEVEELLLRMYEMGEEVSEFHIVEGNRDFTGANKPYQFETVLGSGQFDAWKDKITYHQVEIPKNVTGYGVQEAQRKAMRSQMHSYDSYDQRDILLEGDLDEIVSHKALKILKNCEPVTGGWNAHIRRLAFANHCSLFQ
eukprot:s1984_g12.t1